MARLLVAGLQGHGTAFVGPEATIAPSSPALPELGRRVKSTNEPVHRAPSVGAPGTGTSSLNAVGSFVGLVAVYVAARAAARRGLGVGAARQRRRWQPGSRTPVTARRAEEVVTGFRDAETGETNYVNPWEERVDPELNDPGVEKIWGHKYHEYKGPVYKQVPVIEGLEFPLDPTLYKEPLEPPPPGGKWGDKRSPDGKWYGTFKDKEGNEIKAEYWQALGRRKKACAIVRLLKGTGQFIINTRDAREYFDCQPIWWFKAVEPLCVLSLKNKYDVYVKAFGGGVSGQAGAIRIALARAIQDMNFNYRPFLKRARFLTRDPRMREPKKVGKPKARKSKPYHKR